MLKEHTTVDYACRVADILSRRSGPVPAVDITTSITASQSYVCKVLSRMTRAGLLRSGIDGYELARPLSQISVGDILDVCHTGPGGGPAARAGDKLRELARGIPIGDVL